MKKISLFFFLFFIIGGTIAAPAPALAGQGADELRGLISIFTPTPVERKAEVNAENKGTMLKFQHKIDTFSFGEKTVNLYSGLINGERGRLFLLIENNDPVTVVFYEPQDMELFREFLKKSEAEKKEWIIRDFKKYTGVDLTQK